MKRDMQSDFLDSLEISKRGSVNVVSKDEKVSVSKTDVKKVLKTFEKSPDVSKNTLNTYKQRAELDQNTKQVAQDFFNELSDARKHKKKMHIVTAMSLRQVGMFKIAGRDVYEDLETGDFWKISEDKKHVVRLFSEDDKGIADKKASIEVAAGRFGEGTPEIEESDIKRFEEIQNILSDLIKEAFEIVRKTDNRTVTERARGYWYNTMLGCVSQSDSGINATMFDMDATKEELGEVYHDFLLEGSKKTSSNEPKGPSLEYEDHEAKKHAGKIKGPGVPDGTGPMKDSPSCPCNKNKKSETEKPKILVTLKDGDEVFVKVLGQESSEIIESFKVKYEDLREVGIKGLSLTDKDVKFDISDRLLNWLKDKSI